MLNLIVNILAVLLMIGVAIAGLVYLGPAFTNAQTKATYAAMLNAGAQFQAAEALYKADFGGVYATPAQLVPYYLSATPITPTVFAAGTGWAVTVTPASGAVAASAIATLDITKNATAAIAVCALVPAGAPFGCDSATAPMKFNFNL